jgi:hypothetical protein
MSVSMRTRARDDESRAGPAFTWFAVLGGAVSWSLFTVVVWLLNEIVCSPGAGATASALLGMSFTAVATILTAAFAAVALLAGLAAWRLLGQARRAGDRLGEPRAGRLRFMAAVGLGSDLLHLAIILYFGGALAVLGPCLR